MNARCLAAKRCLSAPKHRLTGVRNERQLASRAGMTGGAADVVVGPGKYFGVDTVAGPSVEERGAAVIVDPTLRSVGTVDGILVRGAQKRVLQRARSLNVSVHVFPGVSANRL